MLHPTLPFGKHAGQPLDTVPTPYLDWLAREARLSSGLRAAVAAELRARGSTPPPPARLRAGCPVRCTRCGSTELRHSWHEYRNGQRQIRRACGRCGTWLGSAPQTPEAVAEADARASKTDILDALTRLDDLGIEVCSDGRSVWAAGDGWRRMPPDLADVLRQCNHRLARLLGRTVG